MIQYYAIRSSGVIALILFTASVVLGLLDTGRVSSERWPRFLIDRVHRNASLLGTVFLAIHILTSVTDNFVAVPVLSAFVPFTHSYSQFWLGLGAASSDLMLAIAITSMVRARLGYRSWRAVHLLSYLAWPIAVLHGIGEGTDTWVVWMLAINILCVAAVLSALTLRLVRVPRLEYV